MENTEVIIVGGGIAGASLGYALAGRCPTVILEAEPHVGYHATGRSAALFITTYGHGVIRALTHASRSFLAAPPDGFSASPLMVARGVLWIARAGQEQRLEQLLRESHTLDPSVTDCSPARALALCPALDPRYLAAAVSEPDAQDIDVGALLQGYLRGFRARGGTLVTNARVDAIRRSGVHWEVVAAGTTYQCRVVVNAAGAWADDVAALAGVAGVGLVPKQRTAITFEAPGVDARAWPCVLDIDEEFYFKPDAGRVLASPADEIAVAPGDAQPDELGVAMTVDRLERATTLRVARVAAKWAGLRSFVADKLPVVGMDPAAPGFFWLAGQGGYGIMTSPALGELAASLIEGRVPAVDRRLGIDLSSLSPARFARGTAPPCDAVDERSRRRERPAENRASDQ